LSKLSLDLYPDYLAHIKQLSGLAVPFQTDTTLQFHPSYTKTFGSSLTPHLTPGDRHFTIFEEHSIDPQQLSAALLAAVRNTSIELIEHTSLRVASETSHGIHLDTSNGRFKAGRLVYTLGAWSFAPVTPRKGQMLLVALPPSLPLREVIRTPEIYIVPRTQGPRAGNALIGATVEDVGFDTATHPEDLAHLRALATQLLPPLADESLCPTVDQWAGLRPATPDHLPLLGPLPEAPNQFLATGHYRNGILLAPATAHVMAQLLSDESLSVDLTSFSPTRISSNEKIAQPYRYSPTEP